MWRKELKQAQSHLPHSKLFLFLAHLQLSPLFLHAWPAVSIPKKIILANVYVTLLKSLVLSLFKSLLNAGSTVHSARTQAGGYCLFNEDCQWWVSATPEQESTWTWASHVLLSSLSATIMLGIPSQWELISSLKMISVQLPLENKTC